MSGIKGRSGRKKEPNALVNEALALVDQHLPDIFNALITKATGITKCPNCGQPMVGFGDRDAQIYLIDRRLGRPKQETDLRVKGIIAFTAEDYELLTRPKAEETRLIAEYSQDEQQKEPNKDKRVPKPANSGAQ